MQEFRPVRVPPRSVHQAKLVVSDPSDTTILLRRMKSEGWELLTVEHLPHVEDAGERILTFTRPDDTPPSPRHIFASHL